MTDDRSFERAARSWLEIGPTEAPERAIEEALLLIDTTPQERDWHVPWRLPKMTTPLRVATAAVIGVFAIGVALYASNATGTLPVIGGPGPTPSPTPSSPPTVLTEQPLLAGRYVTQPFMGPDALGLCMEQSIGCVEDPADDSIRISFAVPSGWSGAPRHSVWLTTEAAAPMGAWVTFERGASLYSRPCGGEPPPDIPVGPTVDDFVNALVVHPQLEVTAPIDVTLGGFSGKSLELQVPADLAACVDAYWPWEPGFYAQGPSQRWHLWVLDVGGTRVVIRGMDFEATSSDRQLELQAIVESIEIQP